MRSVTPSLCLLLLGWNAPGYAQTRLVESGASRFAIVAGNGDRFAAEELRRYVQAITGAAAPIAALAEAPSRREPVLILIGGPPANPRVRELISRIPAVRFGTLKADSFYLWTVREGARTHLIAGDPELHEMNQNRLSALVVRRRHGESARRFLPAQTRAFAPGS